MVSPTYRKTPAGVSAIRERLAGLDARARTLLILCNGLLGEQALAAQMKQPVHALLAQLCQQGLLEAVSPPRALPTVARPAPAAAPAPTPAPQPLEQHPALMQRAWRALEPLFGPGTEDRLQALQQARTPAQVRRALDDLRDALAIYRGRRNAAELIARIEHG